jgi:peptidoglycan hydrolase-like protein with peptidoglycan-binding domain
MTRSGLIISLCFFLSAGCALTDGTESETGGNFTSAPVVEEQSPAPMTVEWAQTEIAFVPRRQPTQDEIRQIQARLREVGLDPGPADGVAGAKTKLAFTRFQSGCAQLKTLLDGGNDAWPAGAAPMKMPSREETLSLQSQFRNAGFNPGPVDGIFGARTRSLFAQLRSGCPMAVETAGVLDLQPEKSTKELSFSSAREPISRPQAVVGASRVDGVKQVAVVVQPAQPQEEIRILQLRLRDAGYDPGPFDGVMGPKTKLALQQYEAAQRSGKIKTSSATGIRVQH